jgi:nickel/cobalt transporter (NiCoT) family protein
MKSTNSKFSRIHDRIPYLRKLPLSAILIIALLVIINLVLWAICGLILAFNSNTHLLGTAALAYSLGLRHALDADHITAIDLMTRRLIATGQRPVTVGTFFSLGHSTIVIITSIVVAATAAGVSKRFDGFSNVGGIVGTSVSAAFLLILGILNAYILYRLIVQIRKVIDLQPDQAAAEAWKIEGGGFLFRVLKRMFKLIDRPWKMYPLGVLFGLGFDTSSEIALLGISSIQGAQGTSIWLILIFPVLFTAGMCLIDTTDGALMMSLYVAPMGMTGDKKAVSQEPQAEPEQEHTLMQLDSSTNIDAPITHAHEEDAMNSSQLRTQVKDPLTFLYYSIVLTTLTVICAIIIGIIQLLSLILNTAHPTGPFWRGVEAAGNNYEIIGGAICGSFIVFGVLSVLCYRPWRRIVNIRRETLRRERRSDEDDDNLERSEGQDVEAARREEEGIIEELVDTEQYQAKSHGGRDGKTLEPHARSIPGQGSGSTA